MKGKTEGTIGDSSTKTMQSTNPKFFFHITRQEQEACQFSEAIILALGHNKPPTSPWLHPPEMECLECKNHHSTPLVKRLRTHGVICLLHPRNFIACKRKKFTSTFTLIVYNVIGYSIPYSVVNVCVCVCVLMSKTFQPNKGYSGSLEWRSYDFRLSRLFVWTFGDLSKGNKEWRLFEFYELSIVNYIVTFWSIVVVSLSGSNTPHSPRSSWQRC